MINVNTCTHFPTPFKIIGKQVKHWYLQTLCSKMLRSSFQITWFSESNSEHRALSYDFKMYMKKISMYTSYNSNRATKSENTLAKSLRSTISKQNNKNSGCMQSCGLWLYDSMQPCGWICFIHEYENGMIHQTFESITDMFYLDCFIFFDASRQLLQKIKSQVYKVSQHPFFKHYRSMCFQCALWYPRMSAKVQNFFLSRPIKVSSITHHYM